MFFLFLVNTQTAFHLCSTPFVYIVIAKKNTFFHIYKKMFIKFCAVLKYSLIFAHYPIGCLIYNNSPPRRGIAIH